MDRPFRVPTIDGGGIRGIGPAAVPTEIGARRTWNAALGRLRRASRSPFVLEEIGRTALRPDDRRDAADAVRAGDALTDEAARRPG